MLEFWEKREDPNGFQRRGGGNVIYKETGIRIKQLQWTLEINKTMASNIWRKIKFQPRLQVPAKLCVQGVDRIKTFSEGKEL